MSDARDGPQHFDYHSKCTQNIRTNCNAEQSNKQKRIDRSISKKQVNSFILHTPQTVLNSVFSFTNKENLVALFDTKTNYIKRTLFVYIEPFYRPASSLLELKLEIGTESIVDTKIMCAMFMPSKTLKIFWTFEYDILAFYGEGGGIVPDFRQGWGATEVAMEQKLYIGKLHSFCMIFLFPIYIAELGSAHPPK